VRTTPDGLQAVLAKSLPSACLATGVEPLLIEESCDLIRARARKDGHADREVHFVERGFDWQALLADAKSLSLFSSRRLIEIRLKGAPDAAAAKALAELAAAPPADTVLLVSGELEPRQQQAAWVKPFEAKGLVVVGSAVERAQLPQWIRKRLVARGANVTDEAAELLADRVEGNLLAAQQEIERIVLLHPGEELDAAAVADLVADNARYDVFELSAAAMLGNAPRALRVLAGLKGEGIAPPFILWALTNDLRGVSQVMHEVAQRRSVDDAMRAANVWSNRRANVQAGIRRLNPRLVESLLVAAARADRVAKGGERGDEWVEIERLVARIAGVPLAA
jgi:DNA polymerase-3 subunit delta